MCVRRLFLLACVCARARGAERAICRSATAVDLECLREIVGWKSPRTYVAHACVVEALGCCASRGTFFAANFRVEVTVRIRGRVLLLGGFGWGRAVLALAVDAMHVELFRSPGRVLPCPELSANLVVRRLIHMVCLYSTVVGQFELLCVGGS